MRAFTYLHFYALSSCVYANERTRLPQGEVVLVLDWRRQGVLAGRGRATLWRRALVQRRVVRGPDEGSKKKQTVFIQVIWILVFVSCALARREKTHLRVPEFLVVNHRMIDTVASQVLGRFA